MKTLSMETQGTLNYVISRFNEPRLRIDPGETIAVETEDAWSGQVRKKGDRRDYTTKPYGNPQSGPIYVNGARDGDSLSIRIGEIKPRIGQGATRTPSYWWYIGSTEAAALQRFLSPNLPEKIRVCPIRDGKVLFSLPLLKGTLYTPNDTENGLIYLALPGGKTIAVAKPKEQEKTLQPGESQPPVARESSKPAPAPEK